MMIRYNQAALYRSIVRRIRFRDSSPEEGVSGMGREKMEARKMAKGFNPMQQVKALQDKMAKVQEELAFKTVEAGAGGGMVTVVVNGKQGLLSLKIDPQVVDPQDVEMLQDLVIAAVNEGMRRAQEMAAGEMGKLAGGLNIPGLKMPGLF